MNSLRYDDMIKKYHYYKNVVIKDYIKRGIYPNNNQIEQTINRIDLALPVLQDYEIHEGSQFDTDKYNDMLKQIYIDLSYLYEITNVLLEERLNYLNSYLQSHILDMKNRAHTYNMRALIEKNSTSLGNTLLNESDVYPDIQDNKCIINLTDSIELKRQSKIACFLTADNIDPDDIVFEFINNKTNTTSYATIYNSNHNTFNVPGDLSYNKYSVELSDNEKVGSKTALTLSNSLYNQDNKYNVYAGKNKIIVKNVSDGSCEIRDVPINTACQIEEHSYIEFYVLDGSDVVFTFNQKPINTNFQLINNSADVTQNNRIFIECDAGFVFNISIDSGTVYADKNADVTINTDSITITNNHKLHDFVVYEYDSAKNTDNYTVNVIINNIKSQQIKIDNILIKELLSSK